MATALIALGSNLGDSAECLRMAVDRLDRSQGIQIRRRSRWWHTEPVGGPAGQPGFLNGAILIETTYSPHELLDTLQAVERAAGRVRDTWWGPRTLDLDLLLYDELQIDSDRLSLPHPRMSFRRFVLEPAAQIAARLRHPTSGRTVGELLAAINTLPNYVAITGPSRVERFELARDLHEQIGSPLVTDHDEGPTRPSPEDSRRGPPASQTLEWLGRWAELLRMDRWRNDSQLQQRLLPAPPGSLCPASAPAVGDFWWDEWRVLLDSAGKHAAALEDVLAAASGWTLVQPKLVVLLQPQLPVEQPIAGETAETPPPPSDDWDLAVKEHGPGPMLRITSRQSAYDEVAAALAAMTSS